MRRLGKKTEMDNITEKQEMSIIPNEPAEDFRRFPTITEKRLV